ncbi:hypothetical protein [Roseobacter sp. CCS2]|uniref:hypothetical protein n=1 Tax=Roseobacter sp. CCS2 TaxID=391593 RepID=UPI0000F4008F|nr:hypothetical protein [Roseobacter sp. CCS2]EBA13783.1 hypothetical protein RCCS2_07839 [Roseobacter sp. CCS2]
MFARNCISLIALSLVTACGNHSDGPADPVPPSISAEVTQADGIISANDALVAFDTTTDSTTVFLFFEGTNQAGFFGFEHGQLEETGEYAGLAVFAPSFRGIEGQVPTAGTGTYDGSFRLAHVTDISTGSDGTQTAGNTQNVRGDLSIEINFDNLDFTGGSSDGSGLTMNGQITNGGQMSGIASFGGTDAVLGGLVLGNTSEQVDSSVTGAFAGGTETELLVGGFGASDLVEDG